MVEEEQVSPGCGDGEEAGTGGGGGGGLDVLSGFLQNVTTIIIGIAFTKDSVMRFFLMAFLGSSYSVSNHCVT
jgi:hypothetical protein